MTSPLFDQLWGQAFERDYVVVQVANWLFAHAPGYKPSAVFAAAQTLAVDLPIGCLNTILQTADANSVEGETDAVETFKVARGLHEAEHGFMEGCGLTENPPAGRQPQVVGIILITE